MMLYDKRLNDKIRQNSIHRYTKSMTWHTKCDILNAVSARQKYEELKTCLHLTPINEIVSIDDIKGVLGSEDYVIRTNEYHFVLTRETKKKAEKIEQLNTFLNTEVGISNKSDEQKQERESKGQLELESGVITTLAGVEAYLKANDDTVAKQDIVNFEYLLEHL